MISLTDVGLGSICIDVSNVETIDDMIPILKAILMWQGFAMYTIDELFDEELKELKHD